MESIITPLEYLEVGENLQVEVHMRSTNSQEVKLVNKSDFEDFLLKQEKIGKLEIQDQYHEEQIWDITAELYFEMMPEYQVLQDLQEYFDSHTNCILPD